VRAAVIGDGTSYGVCDQLKAIGFALEGDGFVVCSRRLGDIGCGRQAGGLRRRARKETVRDRTKAVKLAGTDALSGVEGANMRTPSRGRASPVSRSRGPSGSRTWFGVDVLEAGKVGGGSR